MLAIHVKFITKNIKVHEIVVHMYIFGNSLKSKLCDVILLPRRGFSVCLREHYIRETSSSPFFGNVTDMYLIRIWFVFDLICACHDFQTCCIGVSFHGNKSSKICQTVRQACRKAPSAQKFAQLPSRKALAFYKWSWGAPALGCTNRKIAIAAIWNRNFKSQSAIEIAPESPVNLLKSRLEIATEIAMIRTAAMSSR